MQMIVVHVVGDAEAAARMAALFGAHAELAVLPVEAPPAAAHLMLLWSQAAHQAGAAQRLAELARGRHATLCMLDNTPSPPALSASVSGRLNGPAFERAATGRRDRPEGKGPALRWINAGALATGLARGAAVIAIMGGMALVARAASPEQEVIVGLRPTLSETETLAQRADAAAFGVGRLLPERELRALTVALATEHAQARPVLEARLGAVERTLAEVDEAHADAPSAPAPSQRAAALGLRGPLPI